LLAYVYFEDDGRRAVAKLLTKDEARRIAANTKLEPLRQCAHIYSAKASINRVIGKKKTIAATNVSSSQVSANRQSGNFACQRPMLPPMPRLSLLALKMAGKRQEQG